MCSIVQNHTAYFLCDLWFVHTIELALNVLETETKSKCRQDADSTSHCKEYTDIQYSHISITIEFSLRPLAHRDPLMILAPYNMCFYYVPLGNVL